MKNKELKINEETIRPTIDAILEKQKISADDLFMCAKKGLTAKKNVRDRYGEVIEVEDDFQVQHKFFESLSNMLGYLKPQSVNVQVVSISTEERELMEAYKRNG